MAVNFKADSLQKHKPLAEAIKGGLVAQGTILKETESHSAYFANLPEGLEKKTVEDLAKYNGEFVAAVHVAVGEMSADIFNENKEANQVTAEVGFFGKNDNLSLTVHRAKVNRNNFAQNEEDKEVTKHLSVNATVNVKYGQGLKSLRETMSEEFRDTFVK